MSVLPGGSAGVATVLHRKAIGHRLLRCLGHAEGGTTWAHNAATSYPSARTNPPACAAAGKSKATHYRRLQPRKPRIKTPRPTPANALSPSEVDKVLELLRSERFRDLAPAQVWAILLDEDLYVASVSYTHLTLPTICSV